MSPRRTTALLAAIAALALTPSAAQAAGARAQPPDLPKAAAKSLKGCKKAARKHAPRRCRRPARPAALDRQLVITSGEDPNGVPLVINQGLRWIDNGWSTALPAPGGGWYAVHFWNLVSGASTVVRWHADYYYWTGRDWRWYDSVG